MSGSRILASTGLLLACAGSALAGQPVPVLKTGSYWRSFSTLRTPLVRAKKGDPR